MLLCQACLGYSNKQGNVLLQPQCLCSVFLKGNLSKNLFILHLLKEKVMYINVDKKDIRISLYYQLNIIWGPLVGVELKAYTETCKLWLLIHHC